MTLPVLINPRVQFFDDNGDPLAGGKVYTYEQNSSTPKATYTDATGTTENANPVILDSRGEASIYLSGRYKIVLKDSDDAQIWSESDVSLMPYTTVEQSEWIDQTLTLTYSSATVFTVPGDETAAFVAGRRIKATVSAGTIYGVIKSSAYTSLTTVTCVWDSGSLDSGLSDISLGLIMPTNTGFPNLYALPRYTTTQRDALTASNGMAIYNSTNGKIEAYYASGWKTIVDSTTSGATLTAPTIADFTNMAHDHGDADDGGAIVWQGLPDGATVQHVHSQILTAPTGTTIMPKDDTIPQNTEGDEYLTVTITPKATTNRLVIEGVLVWACANGGTFAAALFQDSAANALNVWPAESESSVNNPRTLPFRHEMAAGTTSATTFKIRAGLDGATTTTINGASGARLYGGVMASSITVTEIKAS